MTPEQTLAWKLRGIVEKYEPICKEDVARFTKIRALYKELEALGVQPHPQGNYLNNYPNGTWPKSVHDLREEVFAAFSEWWESVNPIQ